MRHRPAARSDRERPRPPPHAVPRKSFARPPHPVRRSSRIPRARPHSSVRITLGEGLFIASVAASLAQVVEFADLGWRLRVSRPVYGRWSELGVTRAAKTLRPTRNNGHPVSRIAIPAKPLPGVAENARAATASKPAIYNASSSGNPRIA